MMANTYFVVFYDNIIVNVVHIIIYYLLFSRNYKLYIYERHILK
jgi:hypothetical protein